MNNVNYTKGLIVLIVCVFGSANVSFASSLEQYLNYSGNEYNDTTIYAANQTKETFQQKGSCSREDSCWMSTGNVHKYLGYGTLLMAAAAGVSGGDNGFHKGAGVGAAVLGVATCATGFYEYGNYFDVNEGLSKHNIHIVLGTLATVGFVTVAASAINNDDNGHAGLGIGSTAMAVIPIIVLKF